MKQRKPTVGDPPDLSVATARWCDALSEGVCGSALALIKLQERHDAYYRARVRGLRPGATGFAWIGECPFCHGRLEVDGVTGWWSCAACLRRGEPFGMEYLLFGRNDPGAWETCRRRADALMRGDEDPRRPAAGDRLALEDIA